MELKSQRIVEVKKFYAPYLVEHNGYIVSVFETDEHSTVQVLNGIVIDSPSTEIGTKVELFHGGTNLDCKPFYGDITISQHEH